MKTIEEHFFFPAGDANLESTPFGLKITLRSCKSRGNPGSPDFPGKVIKVALPANTRASKVRAEIQKTAVLSYTPEIVYPVQPVRFVYLDENNQPVSSGDRMVSVDQKAYEDAIKHPAPVVRLLNTEWVENNPVAVLEVVPVRYSKSATIELAEVIKVSVETEKFERVNPVPLKIRRKRARDLSKLHRIVANRSFVESEVVLHPAGDLADAPTDAPPIPLPDEVDYLIITDDNKWDSQTITAGSSTGNMVAEFHRLAAWKSQRGLRTHVARVEDIVNGRYGSFTSGARDLQEIIRNFLKSFCGAKGTEWVLIGGDVSVVPTRLACSPAWGTIYKGQPADTNTGSTDGELSGDNTVAWMGTYLGMRTGFDSHGKLVFGYPGNFLTNYRTGEIIPFDGSGTSNSTTPGWYFCTDDTFSTRTATMTQWVRVNGPKARINDAMTWYTPSNMIATDLYYSSLYSEYYNVPGKKDWDHLNNGLYGQHNTENPHMDGIDYIANIGLGRAPVESDAEAKVIVDKIIEYEKWNEDLANNPIDRFRKMLFVSANWGTYHRIKPDDTNANPPSDARYHSNVAGGYSLIHSELMPPDVGTKLVCEITDTSRTVLSYNPDAGPGNPGWYYARSSNDLSSSQEVVEVMFISIEIPAPTPWIVVYGANNAQLTPMYYAIDSDGPDSSMTQQETLRKWMKSHFYKIDEIQRLYTDETDLDPQDMADGSLRHLTEENLEDALNYGPHFVSFSGHGNSNWVAYLNTALVNRTNNGRYTSIMIADSCLTNKFDDNDSVGENTLKHPGGGAVAYIGNSRYSWVGVGDDFRLEFFKTMQHSRHLGDMNDSRCNFASDNNLKFYWVILSQNLNGDPEMPVYRDIDDALLKYIGNSKSGELHRATCQWVEKMLCTRKVLFASVEQGLNAGYDGCYYCLRQHHTR